MFQGTIQKENGWMALWVFHCEHSVHEKMLFCEQFYDTSFLIDTYIVMNILQRQSLNVTYITVSWEIAYAIACYSELLLKCLMKYSFSFTF